jgi:hypothetical protein
MLRPLVAASGVALASVLAWTAAASAQGQAAQLIRVHAYDGPRRPAAQLASVFTALKDSLLYICGVDGKSVRQLGWISSCPSVVYLLSGEHKLKVDYTIGTLRGEGTVTFKAVAGRTYQVHAARTEERRAAYSVSEMPAGFRLTYKDLSPAYFEKYKAQNALVDPADAK